MKQELPACPVEITMGLIDDKWKILIIRDLLTNNLRDLEKSGLVHREVFAEVPPISSSKYLSTFSSIMLITISQVALTIALFKCPPNTSPLSLV